MLITPIYCILKLQYQTKPLYLIEREIIKLNTKFVGEQLLVILQDSKRRMDWHIFFINS